MYVRSTYKSGYYFYAYLREFHMAPGESKRVLLRNMRTGKVGWAYIYGYSTSYVRGNFDPVSRDFNTYD